jgi:hypothetical protein
MLINNNLANLNRSTRNTIFAALSIIATIAMYNWIVAPHVTYLFAAQRRESVVSKIVKKNEVITREIEAKAEELEKLYEQVARSGSDLFTPDETKEFFSDLQAISEETNCTINSLNLVVSEPSLKDEQFKDTSNIVANSVMLSVSGQYNSIIKLVEKLQNYAKRVWIDSFNVKIIDFGSAQLKCDMTITIYTIQDKEVGPGTSGPIKTAVTGLDSKVDQQVPESYPAMLRDPMRFGPVTTQTSRAEAAGLIVRGIVYSKDNPSAVIGDQILHQGDKVLGAVIIKINEDSVEFEANGKKWTQKVQR